MSTDVSEKQTGSIFTALSERDRGTRMSAGAIDTHGTAPGVCKPRPAARDERPASSIVATLRELEGDAYSVGCLESIQSAA
jgi:hypothetical protein